MKRFIIFIEKNLAGEITEACGSDSFFQVDARLGHKRRHETVVERAKQMNNILKKKYIGYNLYNGE